MAYPLHDAVGTARMAAVGKTEQLLEAVKAMLEAGADVNQCDNNSRTPLDCCVACYDTSSYIMSQPREAGE